MPVSSWSSTANLNTSVGGLTTDGNIQTVNNIDGMFRGMMADIATARDDGTMTTYAPKGFLHGLTTSNNVADSVNDIDVAAGECAADTSPFNRMVLPSMLTKKLDAAWFAGHNQGGRDTGSIADGWWFVYLIKRSDTGQMDVLFSLSATAPTMPASYDLKRRIGAFQRAAGSILLYYQIGDVFKRQSPVALYNNAAARPSATLYSASPIGIVSQPILQFTLTVNAASNVSLLLGDAAAGVANCTISNQAGGASVVTETNLVLGGFFTNTLGEIYQSTVLNSGTAAGCTIDALGHIDSRGQV